MAVAYNSACLHLFSESLAIGSHFLFSLRGEIPYFTYIRLLNVNFIQYLYVGSFSGSISVNCGKILRKRAHTGFRRFGVIVLNFFLLFPRWECTGRAGADSTVFRFYPVSHLFSLTRLRFPPWQPLSLRSLGGLESQRRKAKSEER